MARIDITYIDGEKKATSSINFEPNIDAHNVIIRKQVNEFITKCINKVNKDN